MTKIKRTKATSKSSKFTEKKAPMSTQLAEEAKAYRKAKVAFRVYASIRAFDRALNELMYLNQIACWSKHPYITGDSPDGFCFSKYPGRWTQGMLKLVPVKELIDFRCERHAEICFGNIKVIDEYLKQQRHKIVYNLIASEKLKVTRSQLSSYIHECLAQQPYVYHTCFFPDWEIKVNWVEQKLIRYNESAGSEGSADAD